MNALRAFLAEIAGLFVGSAAETATVLLLLIVSYALARGNAGVWAGVTLCAGVCVTLFAFTAADARRRHRRAGRR